MNMRIECRASLTVEASLVFPFTVLMLALFLGVLRGFATYYAFRIAVCETADKMADYAYAYELLEDELKKQAEAQAGTSEQEETTAPEGWLAEKAEALLLDQLLGSLAHRLVLEFLPTGFTGKEFSMSGSRFFYEQGTHRALFRITLHYQPQLLDGGTVFDPAPVTISCVTHAFVGDGLRTSEEIESAKVYRIGAGEKYHSKDCYLINKNITEMPIWEAQEAGLLPCSQCHCWESETVYVSKGGERYHAKGCAHLYAAVEELELSVAVEMGLSPCKICLGDKEWFVGNE